MTSKKSAKKRGRVPSVLPPAAEKRLVELTQGYDKVRVARQKEIDKLIQAGQSFSAIARAAGVSAAAITQRARVLEET